MVIVSAGVHRTLLQVCTLWTLVSGSVYQGVQAPSSIFPYGCHNQWGRKNTTLLQKLKQKNVKATTCLSTLKCSCDIKWISPT